MNLEEARALAEEYYNGVRSPGESLPVGVFGFDGGYVAWVRDLEPDDPARLPETVGGGCVVIDRFTGEVVARPLLDPETVAELWPGRTPR
ncbi:hypothetical protein BKM31_36065 [[Actinomadura] parvosata subsp. kistnae]|uniref:Immunity protein 35 domain-containing protein n=2 Tax=Nonomuraea TaxID=83681 RepID=A0A1V0A7J3_9ACTN|nr:MULTISPECIES: hypothetical protein [unclassified Nonomuraea]AQZ66153.1 hypothetical protein BKM31_36065 [Nonomuraea sp. ATCC 55076]NJP92183.1 hypothetical protein [Nonomuraea sp. FMUSA5-5]